MEYFIYLALFYIIIVTIAGFTFMGVDKQRARKNGWRISERTLLLLALIGGGIGSFLGMRYFHHKTKHTRFVILLPLTAIIDIVLVIKLLSYLGNILGS